MASLAEIQAIVEQIKADLPLLINRSQIAPKQIVTLTGLSDISERLGLIQAGEFRAGNGQEPGHGFTGVRMGYPAFSYSSDTWNIAGVNNDVIQFGLRATDGVAIAGGGNVILSSTGIVFKNNAQTLVFRNAADTGNAGLIYAASSNNFFISQQAAGGAVIVAATPADGVGYVYLGVQEHDVYPGVIQVNLGQSSLTTLDGYNLHMGGISLWSGKDGQVTTFNDDSYDVDFRIEGATDANLFKLDAGLDKVIISNLEATTLEATTLTWDGWTKEPNTWTRVSDTQFTIANADLQGTFRKGTKIRWKNGGGYKYGVVASSSYAGVTTTVNLIPTTDYAMTATPDAGSTYVSNIEKPNEWPDWFNFTTSPSRSGGAYSTNPTILIAKWKAVGQQIFVTVRALMAAVPGSLGFQVYTLPTSPAASGIAVGMQASDIYAMSAIFDAGSSQLRAWKYDGTAEAVASKIYHFSGQYQF